TDAEGRFRFMSTGVDAAVCVEAPGRRIVVRQVAPEETSITIRLSATAMVQGRVFDAARSAPLPGSQVGAIVFGDGVVASEVVADAEGRFALAVPASTSLMLFAKKEGFALLPDGANGPTARQGLVLLPGMEEGTTKIVDLPMRGGVVVAGRVVDPDGVPVPDAVVEALPFRATAWNLVAAAATSGADGTFRFTSLPAGRMAFLPRKEGWCHVPSPTAGERDPGARAGDFLTQIFPFVLDPDSPAPDVTLTLRRGRVLSGTAMGDDGRPAAGACVRWRRSASPSAFRPSRGEEPSTFADAAGRFLLTGVPLSDGVVDAVHGEYSGGFEAPVSVSEVGPLALTLAAGATVSGTVTYPDGAPAVDVALLYLAAGASASVGQADTPRRRRTRTDAAGRFRFDDVAPGEGRLVLSEENSGRWALARAATPAREAKYFFSEPERRFMLRSKEATTCALRLLPPAEISGVAVDADGAPVVAEVLATVLDRPKDDPAPFIEGFAEARATPDANGRFRLAGLKPDRRYRLTCGVDAVVDDDAPPPAPAPSSDADSPPSPRRRSATLDAVSAGAVGVVLREQRP
ncbi:MAG TPA: carboxypeptidase-like regulatory domain-containing protein, partial [Planctomycetota bacterium]|nr:carboxypeptidase-like regulatory domain-containing protein [Planctomycetota bacterium]